MASALPRSSPAASKNTSAVCRLPSPRSRRRSGRLSRYSSGSLKPSAAGLVASGSRSRSYRSSAISRSRRWVSPPIAVMEAPYARPTRLRSSLISTETYVLLPDALGPRRAMIRVSWSV